MAQQTIVLRGGGGAPHLERGSIQFVGTATVLVRYAGFTVLTDPNFLHAGDHAHLGWGLTSRRRTDPAMEIDDLPPLDLCLLSHLHGDHWDEVASARLDKGLPVVTTRQAARALRRQGFRRALGLRTWDSVHAIKGMAWLKVTAMPGRHGPPVFDALLPRVNGSLLEYGVGERDSDPLWRLYVSGDTLVTDELRRIPERYPSIDCGLFHLGGTRVLGVLVSLDARQGVEAVRIIHPGVAVPIHYDDYPVFKSPLEDFLLEAAGARLATRVHPLARGEILELGVPRAAAELAPGGEGVVLPAEEPGAGERRPEPPPRWPH